MKQNVTASIPTDYIEKIDDMADGLRTSRSTVVRKVLMQYFDEKEGREGTIEARIEKLEERLDALCRVGHFVVG